LVRCLFGGFRRRMGLTEVVVVFSGKKVLGNKGARGGRDKPSASRKTIFWGVRFLGAQGKVGSARRRGPFWTMGVRRRGERETVCIGTHL